MEDNDQYSNRSKISKMSEKFIFLVDSSAYCRLEEIKKLSGIDVLKSIKNCRAVTFLVTTEVLMELMNGPRNVDTDFFIDNLLSTQGSFMSGWKENRFIIDDGKGNVSAMQLSKVSSTDWNQVTLCQEHEDLNLVCNDEKMFKNAEYLIKERAFGLLRFLDKLIELEPDVNEFTKARDCLVSKFKRKHINSQWI